LNIWTQFMDVA